jgi:3-methyladenine DNA glycosylase Tag
MGSLQIKTVREVWNTFDFEKCTNAHILQMAQGEGISLLIRANHISHNEKYEKAIHQAYKYMIIPIEEGGTTKYDGDQVYLYECPADPLILNGWIFSLWGIWDYVKEYRDIDASKVVSKDNKYFRKVFHKYDISIIGAKYEDGKRICKSVLS